MKKLLFLILAGMLFSCKNTQKKETLEVQKPVKNLTKLETLYSLPKDSIYEFYDLSNDSIKEFPDLSKYSIKKLDLSHNQIKKFLIDCLPKGVKKIDVSFNHLTLISYGENKTLKEINVSHNYIEACDISLKLERFNISNNRLKYITINSDSLRFLNISNNSNLNNALGFPVDKVDTIVRDNIANNKPLRQIGIGIIVE